jgi:hypothetical protein
MATDDDGFKQLPAGVRVIDSAPSDAARAAARESLPDPDRWQDNGVYPTRAIQPDLPKAGRVAEPFGMPAELEKLHPNKTAKIDRRYVDRDQPRSIPLDDLYKHLRGPVAEGVGRDGGGWLPEIGVPSRNRLPPASERVSGVADAPENFPQRSPDHAPGPAERAIKAGLDWLRKKRGE